jgi:hypothetical protein
VPALELEVLGHGRRGDLTCDPECGASAMRSLGLDSGLALRFCGEGLAFCSPFCRRMWDLAAESDVGCSCSVQSQRNTSHLDMLLSR